ncbi:MAG: hypothetical protein JWP13_314 [Candidatus Saccharibacteria bacterium]|nr:hypothetical protein [Candidatus Saccharibacteria bacterium]
MTSLLERPRQLYHEDTTQLIASGQLAQEQERVLEELNSSIQHVSSTQVLEVPTYQLVEVPTSLHDPSTEFMDTDRRRGKKLPPAATDPYQAHDLAKEADTIPGHEEWASADEIVRPPLITPEDAITTLSALQRLKDKLTKKYGEEAYEQTVAKSLAILDVSVAAEHLGAQGAFKQYNLLRRGEQQDRSLAPLDLENGDIDALVEEPLHEVSPEPLIFNPAESQVVLSALRMTAYRRSARGDDRAAKDLLSRYAHSTKQRAYYGNMLKNAGVQLDIGHVPEYK